MMLAIPAIDLREGKVVQLVGGDYANEAVRLDNPVEVAREWVRAGFTRLHCVDLDAATGRGTNHAAIRTLLDDDEALFQVGGGIRTADRVQALLEAGAAFVVVGTRAIEETDWMAELADAHPGRIIVAADVRAVSIYFRCQIDVVIDEQDCVKLIADIEQSPRLFATQRRRSKQCLDLSKSARELFHGLNQRGAIQ